MPKNEVVQEVKDSAVPEPQKQSGDSAEKIEAPNLASFVAPEKTEKETTDAAELEKQKKDEEEERKKYEGRVTVVQAIRENVRRNMQDVNAKSRVKRAKMSDAHREDARKIVTILDSSKLIARHQKWLDFEQQYNTKKDLKKEDLEADIKVFLEGVKADFEKKAEADEAKANAEKEAAAARVAAVKARKTAENTTMTDRLKEIAKRSAAYSKGKAEDADSSAKKTVSEAEPKIDAAVADEKNDSEEAKKKALVDQSNAESSGKEKPVEVVPPQEGEQVAKAGAGEANSEVEKKEPVPEVEGGVPEANKITAEIKEPGPEVNASGPEVEPPVGEVKEPGPEVNPPVEKAKEPPKEGEEAAQEVQEEGTAEELFDSDSLNKSFDADDEEAQKIVKEALAEEKAEGEGSEEIVPPELNEAFIEDEEEEKEEKDSAKALKDEADKINPEAPKDALKTLKLDIAQIPGIDPDAKKGINGDIAAFSELLRKVSSGGPYFRKITASSNRSRYKKDEADLKAKEEEIKKISAEWEEKYKYYRDTTVQYLNDDYDSLAQTWYEITHEYAVSRLGPDATEQQISSALQNRSIPEDAAKEIEEYAGLFDEAGLGAILGDMKRNPYKPYNPYNLPKKSAAPPDSKPSDDEFSVIHDKITMYSTPDRMGVRHKYQFDRTFMGEETFDNNEAETKGRRGKKSRRRGNNGSNPGTRYILHAEQASLISDELDSRGNWKYSEYDPHLINQLSSQYGIDVSDLDKYSPTNRSRSERNYNLDLAIQNCIFFKHINSLSIRFYSTYGENDADKAAFSLAPELNSFTKWALDNAKLGTARFTSSLATLLGDPTYATYPFFNQVLEHSTGIPNKTLLPDLTKIFMVIDYFELSKNAKSPEDKGLAESISKTLFVGMTPEALKKATLDDLFKHIQLTNWRTILKDLNTVHVIQPPTEEEGAGANGEAAVEGEVKAPGNKT